MEKFKQLNREEKSNEFNNCRQLITFSEETNVDERDSKTQNKMKKNSIDHLLIPGILRVNIKKYEDDDEKKKKKLMIKTNHNLKSNVKNSISASSFFDTVKKNHYPIWFSEVSSHNIKHIKELPHMHDKLNEFIEKNTVFKNWNKVCEYRQKLQLIFSTLLLSHRLKFCCEKSIETYFWKILYYNLIEHFRRQQEEQRYQKRKNNLQMKEAQIIINDGIEFYENLLNQFSAMYQLDISSNDHSSREGESNLRKFESIAKVSMQKMFICLGDLSRYKTKLLNTDNDYTVAGMYYEKAQIIQPSNGIPYNQLAILAIYKKNKLNAVYYHMRSLMSSNSISTARESLKIIFDGIRKKYEEENKYRKNTKNSNESNISSSLERNNSLREEIWIDPDGIRRLNRNIDSFNKIGDCNLLETEHQLNDLPSDELMRDFLTLYLYIIGKLFSGIGLENIQKQQEDLMAILKIILNKNHQGSSPLIISRDHLLKMVALNIFVVEYNYKISMRKEIRYYSFIITNQFFGFILRKLIELINKTNGETIELDAESMDFIDLNTLLQYVKIWCDWLQLNIDLWEPARTQEWYNVINPWTKLIHLFDLIQKMFDNFEEEKGKTPQSVILDEDQFLHSFTPIQSKLHNTSFRENVSQEFDQFRIRLEKILIFSKIFYENKSKLISNQRAEGENLHILENVETDHISDNSDEDINSFGIENDKITEEITKMSKLKKELESKAIIKRMYSEKLNVISKNYDKRIHLEVRPKYLLTDTNCFIDNLEEIQKLNENFKRYTIIVPLTVVKELDGLSKGVKLESSTNIKAKISRIHHFDEVSTRAKNSLDFIQTTRNNVKCASTKGSYINSSLFGLVEELNVSNDDKILATALALSKDMNIEKNSNGKKFIQTELVLLTTDRNLRVKALSRNLAVSNMSEFLSYANDRK